MEVMTETPPPLPPKTRKALGAVFAVTRANHSHSEEDTPPPWPTLKEVTEETKMSVAGNGTSQVALVLTECKSETRKQRDLRTNVDDLYENVSNVGMNYLEQRLQSLVSENDRASKGTKRTTPKIEVRQEENKTVVKISIKDATTPEGEVSGENRFKRVCTNGFSCISETEDERKGRAEEGGVYENVAVGVRSGCENLSEGCYENVEERVYENSAFSRGSREDWRSKANCYGSTEEDGECKEGCEGAEFRIFRNGVLEIIGRNVVSSAKIAKSDRENDDSDEKIRADHRIYANENLCRPNETAEKDESEKKSEKSSVVQVFLQKPTMVKVEKKDAECADSNSSGDPFDSGTCSDVDSLPTFVQNKKGNVIVTIKSLGEDRPEDKKMDSGHGRAESLTSSGVGVDSEESDDSKSSISCDSLNNSDPYVQYFAEDHGYHTPTSDDKTGSPIDRTDYENGVEKTDIIQQMADASRKIKNLRLQNVVTYAAELAQPSSFEDYENIFILNSHKIYKKKLLPPTPPVKRATDAASLSGKDDDKKTLPKSLLRDICSRNVLLSAAHPSGKTQNGDGNAITSSALRLEDKASPKIRTNEIKHLMIEEKTYEERKSEGGVQVSRICAMEVDTEKFYKFHLAEKVHDKGGESGDDNEETFAGVKNFLCSEKPSAITSAKGTIRGVKNRVKAGIATFLQLQENKSYKDKDAGKVVVYTTTMGIVRDTYHKCLKVKQILKTLMVKFEERDVFMSAEAQEEIRDRMKCNAIMVPQVFVEGQYIGDAETIDRLNETGELRTMLKPYKSADACSTCKVCGGYRLLPCSVCKGSKKSIHRNHFTAEFVALKCMNCDQVGLIKCHAC